MKRQSFNDLEMLEFDDLEMLESEEEKLKCHYCGKILHENDNAMDRCMSGQESAPKGFGWISVIVKPFKEVPCCDICFDLPTTKYLMC